MPRPHLPVMIIRFRHEGFDDIAEGIYHQMALALCGLAHGFVDARPHELAANPPLSALYRGWI